MPSAHELRPPHIQAVLIGTMPSPPEIIAMKVFSLPGTAALSSAVSASENASASAGPLQPADLTLKVLGILQALGKSPHWRRV